MDSICAVSSHALSYSTYVNRNCFQSSKTYWITLITLKTDSIKALLLNWISWQTSEQFSVNVVICESLTSDNAVLSMNLHFTCSIVELCHNFYLFLPDPIWLEKLKPIMCHCHESWLYCRQTVLEIVKCSGDMKSYWEEYRSIVIAARPTALMHLRRVRADQEKLRLMHMQ